MTNMPLAEPQTHVHLLSAIILLARVSHDCLHLGEDKDRSLASIKTTQTHTSKQCLIFSNEHTQCCEKPHTGVI